MYLNLFGYSYYKYILINNYKIYTISAFLSTVYIGDSKSVFVIEIEIEKNLIWFNSNSKFFTSYRLIYWLEITPKLFKIVKVSRTSKKAIYVYLSDSKNTDFNIQKSLYYPKDSNDRYHFTILGAKNGGSVIRNSDIIEQIRLWGSKRVLVAS